MLEVYPAIALFDYSRGAEAVLSPTIKIFLLALVVAILAPLTSSFFGEPKTEEDKRE